MHDPIGFFDTLTIPTDAGPTDPRVEINVIDGTINIYGTGGVLVGSLTPTGPGGEPGFFVFNSANDNDYVALENVGSFPGISFSSSDPSLNTIGRFSLSVTGAGGTRNFQYTVKTPSFTGQLAAAFEMISDSQDGTEDAFTNFTQGDLRVDNASVARGCMGSFFDDTTDGPFAVTTDTDMVINNIGAGRGGVKAGRLYMINLHCLAQFSVAPAQWNLFARINGADLARIYRLDTASEDLNANIDASIPWIPSVDSLTDDLVIRAVEVSGAASLSFLGSGVGTNNLIRSLTVMDEGLP